MSVDAGFAAWLQSEALFVARSDATLAARWGTKAVESEGMTPLALRADVEAEADRQLEFLGGPLVRDTHLVKGLRRDLIGRVVTITGDRLGYTAAGKPCFVVGVEEIDGAEMSRLTVIASLAYVPAAWTPAALYVGGFTGAWFDPSDLSTLFKLSTDPTPNVVDGDPVGKILDKSGNGNDLIQATAGFRPIYRAGGGKPYLEFDGVDDRLGRAATQCVDPISGHWSAAVAARVTASANVGVLDNDGVSSQRIAQFVSVNTSQALLATAFTTSASFATDTGPTLTLGTSFVAMALRDSAGVEAFLNGASNGSSAIGSPAIATGPLHIGAKGLVGSEIQFMTGRFYGGAMVGKYLSVDDQTAIQAHMTGKL